jgi:hypothetical protein
MAVRSGGEVMSPIFCMSPSLDSVGGDVEEDEAEGIAADDEAEGIAAADADVD